LSTAVLVRLGGAYGNLMVGMRPVNAKLRRRAAAIVAQAAQVPLDAAAEALARAKDDLRSAIVVARTGVEPEQARTLLARHDGRVRDALREIEEARGGSA